MKAPLARPVPRAAAAAFLAAAAAAAAAVAVVAGARGTAIGGDSTTETASVLPAARPPLHQSLLSLLARLRRAAPRPGRGRRQLRQRRAAAVGRRLEALRRSAGLSAEQLAWRAGIGLDYYLRVEAGHPEAVSLLPVDLVYTVASALDTTPAELLQGLE